MDKRILLLMLAEGLKDLAHLANEAKMDPESILTMLSDMADHIEHVATASNTDEIVAFVDKELGPGEGEKAISRARQILEKAHE